MNKKRLIFSFLIISVLIAAFAYSAGQNAGQLSGKQINFTDKSAAQNANLLKALTWDELMNLLTTWAQNHEARLQVFAQETAGYPNLTPQEQSFASYISTNPENNNKLTAEKRDAFLNQLTHAVTNHEMRLRNINQPSPADCQAESISVGGNLYNVPALNHGMTQTIRGSRVMGTPANGYTDYVVTFSCTNGALNHGSPSAQIACNAGYTLQGSRCVANTVTYQFTRKKWSTIGYTQDSIKPFNDRTYGINNDKLYRSSNHYPSTSWRSDCILRQRFNDDVGSTNCSELADANSSASNYNRNSLRIGHQAIWDVCPSGAMLGCQPSIHFDNSWLGPQGYDKHAIVYVDKNESQWLYKHDYKQGATGMPGWLARTYNGAATTTFDYTDAFCECDKDDTKRECNADGWTEQHPANYSKTHCYDMGPKGEIRAFTIIRKG